MKTIYINKYLKIAQINQDNSIPNTYQNIENITKFGS